MKTNIAVILVAIMAIIAAVGCKRSDPDQGQLALEKENSANLNAEVKRLKGEMDSALAEKEVLALRVETLQNTTKVLVEVATSFSNQLATVVVEKETLAIRAESLQNTANDLAGLTTSLSNQLANAISVRTNTATVPAAPIATTATNVSTTGANIIAVVTSANNSVVFYSDGSVATTNAPVGMVDGLPVLIDNVSRKTVALVLKRIGKPGSITLPEIPSGTEIRVTMLPAQYDCTWRIKGQFAVAGSCTMTVNDGPPTDLVVGKGAFNGTLTLVDR